MVTLGISEFTFGYAFLHEQTLQNWNNLRMAPILPSLRQEAGQGWDAHLPLIGTDFYYQFKLSDRLIRSNARERQNGTYSSPYYRFYLHSRDNNRQHRMLWQHAQSNPHTYYVAPEIESYQEFNRAFLNQSITAHSRIIPLNQCTTYSPHDSASHYITYQSGNNNFMQFSDPHEGRGTVSGMEIQSLYESSRQRWTNIDTQFALRVLENVRARLKELANDELRKTDRSFEEAIHRLHDVPVASSRNEMLWRAAHLMSIVFGVTMVIVGEGSSNDI